MAVTLTNCVDLSKLDLVHAGRKKVITFICLYLTLHLTSHLTLYITYNSSGKLNSIGRANHTSVFRLWPLFLLCCAISSISGLWWLTGEAGKGERLFKASLRSLFRPDHSQQRHRRDHQVRREVWSLWVYWSWSISRILERALEKINCTPQWVPISWVYWPIDTNDRGKTTGTAPGPALSDEDLQSFMLHKQQLFASIVGASAQTIHTANCIQNWTSGISYKWCYGLETPFYYQWSKI